MWLELQRSKLEFYLKKLKKKILKNKEFDGAPENHNPPIPLNSLFSEDSTDTDSDADLAEELDEFFRFMIWNDLWGEKEQEESSFIEEESIWVSATDLFAESDVFDDSITDDSDDDPSLRARPKATRCVTVW